MQKQPENHIEENLHKSGRAIKEAELLFINEFYETAVSCLYYACLYAVKEFLIKDGVRIKSHTGAKQMFGLYLIRSGIIQQERGEFYSSYNTTGKRLTADGADYTKI